MKTQNIESAQLTGEAQVPDILPYPRNTVWESSVFRERGINYKGEERYSV